jgi:Tol biopolymer transport system component
MPDMREVYDMVTKQTPHQADPLEQQHRRQRSAARKRRVGAYAAVAAVLILLAIASVAISRAVQRNDVTPEGQGSSTPSNLTFTGTLPPGATPQKLAVVDLQGKQISVVQNVPPQAFTPSLSADGSTIAFTDAPPEIGYNQVAIMRTDGSDAHFLPTPGIDVGLIAISPDASRVAFAGDAGNGNDIYVMNTDGSGLRRLTNDPATDQFPQWSPDGNTIVYDNAGAQEKPSDAQFSKTAEIFTVPADGSESPTQITHNTGYDAAPSFSPDGKSIADESFRGISVMNTDGSNSRSVSGSGGFSPRWSPDGTKLAFLSFSSRYQPSVQLGETYNPDAPLLQLGVAVVANGQVTKLPDVVTATNLNAPQWTDDGHVMVLRAPPMEPSR